MGEAIDCLRRYIADHPLKDACSDAETLAQVLYYFYMEGNCVNTDAVKKGFQNLDRLTGDLSFRKKDAICSEVVSICREQERQAFLGGMRVGAQLVIELLDE